MYPIKILLKSTRLPFLILTPVCVLLGVATAVSDHHGIDLHLLLLVLLGAIAAHVSVNTLNEYHDYHSGLDSKTIKTPFSGGSGALQLQPEMADSILIVGVVSLIVTISIGILLLIEQGILILPIGVLGVAIILTYTKWINRSPLLCLIAPGVAFGPLMVVGTHVALTGQFSSLAMMMSIVPFFLVNNLLLLNQIPDIQADASVGRQTFPIAYGSKNSAFVYGVFAACGFAVIPWAVYQAYITPIGLIAMLPLLLAVSALYGFSRYSDNVDKLIPFMGFNVGASILTPLLLGGCIFLN
jgi:1,4-dihydroxy-2-naphthoate polyprenyltransferase